MIPPWHPSWHHGLRKITYFCRGFLKASLKLKRVVTLPFRKKLAAHPVTYFPLVVAQKTLSGRKSEREYFDDL
jgi:hypothetical protein